MINSIKYAKSKVNKAIKVFGMFKRTDKVLVTISGGMDSILLGYILKNMGYNIKLLFINLGSEFSIRSLPFVRKVSEKLNIPIRYVSTLEEVARHLPSEIEGEIFPIKMFMREDWM